MTDQATHDRCNLLDGNCPSTGVQKLISQSGEAGGKCKFEQLHSSTEKVRKTVCLERDLAPS